MIKETWVLSWENADSNELFERKFSTPDAANYAWSMLHRDDSRAMNIEIKKKCVHD
jgi:hypothetical protein